MKNQVTTKRFIFAVIAVIMVALMFGCSGGKDLTAEVSGKWQREGADGIVEINLTKEPLMLTMDGKSYPVTIEKVDKGNHSLHLKVQTDASQAEEWILRQVWDDNGSSFTIGLIHNGTQEKLVSNKKS
jgi:hypothetical protein